MTTDTSVRCALGVTSRTLSDFHSDGLSVNDMERLGAHVAQCPACQARLDEFETIARRLRDHPELDGHAQLWRSVQASITAMSAPSAAQGSRAAHGAGRSSSGRLWTALGSIAAVIALSVGFVAAFLSRAGWPPVSTIATPTPIIIHSGSLTWRQVIVPKGFPGTVDQGDAPATVDAPAVEGATMYACQADRRYVPSPRVWATRDAGAHWAVITPPDLAANTGGCRLWVDGTDANTLVVSFFPVRNLQQPEPPSQWVTYATFDGGATWSKPAGLQDGTAMGMLASAHGRIYALRANSSPSGESHTGLYVSGDDMRSWRQIDASLPDTQPNPPQAHDTGKVFQMWIDPASGEVLAITYAGTLWSTMDAGARWTKLAYPQGVFTADPWAPRLVVGGPTTSGHLMICGDFAPLQSPETHHWFECTANDGQTWSERPTATSWSRSAPAYQLDLTGVGADGSLYAMSQIPSAPGVALYRLPSGGAAPSGWQLLGAIPGSQHGFGYQVAQSASGIVIWDFPVRGVDSSGLGTKTYVQPNYYVATYP